MNDGNLIPLNRRTKEERREIATQGGIASGESRRERKRLREYLEAALVLDTDYRGEAMSNAEAVTAALIRKAKRGDVRAYCTIRDGLGEKPAERIEAVAPISEEARREVEDLLFGTASNSGVEHGH